LNSLEFIYRTSSEVTGTQLIQSKQAMEKTNTELDTSQVEETGEVIVFQGQNTLSKAPDQTSPTKKKNKKKKKPTSPNGAHSQQTNNPHSNGNEEDTIPLEERILLQVEYYFSDNNLKNDKFMQQAMETSNSDGQGPPEQQIPWSGWIRLDTLYTFPKLQSLTKDIQVIRDALKKSKRLVLSEDGSWIRRTCSYTLNVNTPSGKQRKSDERTLYISYLPKDFDKNKLSEMFSSLSIESSTIKRVDLPLKNAHVQAQGTHSTPAPGSEIKGVAFVEFRSKEDMNKALDIWKNSKSSSDYSKQGIKMKPYTGNTTNHKTANEQSPTKEEPAVSNIKNTSIYESSPTFNYTNSKSKRRPSLSDKDKQRWEPDPSTSAMRPKLNLLPRGSSAKTDNNTTDGSPSQSSQSNNNNHPAPPDSAAGGAIHPIRQPKGPDSTSSRGFAKQQRGKGRGKLVL
jgi:hypothetical protein